MGEGAEGGQGMGRDGRGRIRRLKDNVWNSNLPTGMKLQWGPHSRFPSCVHHHHSPTISGAPYTMGISPRDTADHVTSIMGRSGEGCVAEMVERKQLDLVIKAAWEENDFSSTLCHVHAPYVEIFPHLRPLCCHGY